MKGNLTEEEVFLHPRPANQAFPEQPCANIARLMACRCQERTWDGAPNTKNWSSGLSKEQSIHAHQGHGQDLTNVLAGMNQVLHK